MKKKKDNSASVKDAAPFKKGRKRIYTLIINPAPVKKKKKSPKRLIRLVHSQSGLQIERAVRS